MSGVAAKAATSEYEEPIFGLEGVANVHADTVRRHVTAVSARVGEPEGGAFARLRFDAETDAEEVVELFALQSGNTRVTDAHRAFGFGVAEEVHPVDVALNLHVDACELEGESAANAELRNFDVLVVEVRSHRVATHLFAEAVGLRVDPREAEVGFDRVGVGVETRVGHFTEELHDVGVIGRGIHARRVHEDEPALELAILPRVGEAVRGRDRTDVRFAVDTGVDVVAVDVAVVAALEVRRAGAEEDAELRRGADLEFAADQTGVEVGVEVGRSAARVRIAPSADAGPQSSTPLSSFAVLAVP